MMNKYNLLFIELLLVLFKMVPSRYIRIDIVDDGKYGTYIDKKRNALSIIYLHNSFSEKILLCSKDIIT